MTTAEESKAALVRWYDEMWFRKNFELVPECVGPNYTRHEPGGTRTITAEEYRDFLVEHMGAVEIAAPDRQESRWSIRDWRGLRSNGAPVMTMMWSTPTST